VNVLIILLVLSVFLVLGVGLYIMTKINTKPLDRIKDLSDVFPINQIEHGVIINGRGDLTVGFELSLPDVFTISESEADVIHDSFVGLFKLLPEGAIIHRQDFFFLDKKEQAKQGKSIIQQENFNLSVGRPQLKCKSFLYLTVCNRIRYSKSFTTSLQRSPNFLFKAPSWTKDYEKNIEKFNRLTDTFFNALNGIIGVQAKRLDDESLLEQIYRYVSMKLDCELSSAERERYVLDPIEVNDAGNMKIGKYNIRVLSLAEESSNIFNHSIPKTAPASSYNNGVTYSNTIKSKTSFIFPIACGLPVDHVLNTTIQILDNDRVLQELTSEQKMLNFLGHFYPPANVKHSVIQGFIDTILNKKYQVCKTGVNVILRETDAYQMERSLSGAEVAFINMGRSKAYIENFDSANIFFSMIPGNAETNYREFINTTAQATCYLNKEGMVKGDVHGITFTDRYGNPVVVDLWNNKNLVNRNKIVLGPSGSGKSFFINELISQTLDLGNHIIVIDIGHSYKRNVEFNRGKYYDSDDKKSLSFNLFDCKRDTDGNYLYIDTEDEEGTEDKINFIVTVLLTIIKGKTEVTNLEKVLYKNSVKDYYGWVNKNKQTASLGGYYDFLQDYEKTIKPEHRRILRVSDIQVILTSFVSGEHKHLLNSQRTLDIENDRFVVFDLEAIQKDETVFPIMVLIVIETVIQKIKSLKGIRKSLIIDEGLDFLQDPKMGEFIGYLYRTFRKKEGEVILAAQNVKFLESATPVVRDSIVLNSATTILLDHSEHTSNYKDLQNILSLSDHHIELLDSVEKTESYREFFMKLGKTANIFRMEVSKFAQAVYTSKQSEVIEIESLRDKTGSLTSAIHRYIERK